MADDDGERENEREKVLVHKEGRSALYLSSVWLFRLQNCLYTHTHTHTPKREYRKRERFYVFLSLSPSSRLYDLLTEEDIDDFVSVDIPEDTSASDTTTHLPTDRKMNIIFSSFSLHIFSSFFLHTLVIYIPSFSILLMYTHTHTRLCMYMHN